MLALYSPSRCSFLRSSTRYQLTSQIKLSPLCSLEYRLDIVPLPPTYSPSPSTLLLVPQLARLGSTATAREGAVCLLRMYFRPQVQVRWVDFPSISLCTGVYDLRWSRSNDLTSRSWGRVHHLDGFQVPWIIVLCRVPCRVVSVACFLEVVG